MRITDPKKEDYVGYCDVVNPDEDHSLYSIESYAENHYWAYERPVWPEAIYSHLIGSGRGWVVILEHEVLESIVMRVYWDVKHDCLNADCLYDSSRKF